MSLGLKVQLGNGNVRSARQIFAFEHLKKMAGSIEIAPYN